MRGFYCRDFSCPRLQTFSGLSWALCVPMVALLSTHTVWSGLLRVVLIILAPTSFAGVSECMLSLNMTILNGLWHLLHDFAVWTWTTTTRCICAFSRVSFGFPSMNILRIVAQSLCNVSWMSIYVSRTLVECWTGVDRRPGRRPGDSGGRTTSYKATCHERVAVHHVVHRHFTLHRRTK